MKTAALVALLCVSGATASLVVGGHSAKAANHHAAKIHQKQKKDDAETGTNPIAKVLELLGKLQAKVIMEGELEQKNYDEFSEWCEDESKQKQFEIKTGKLNIEELTATISKSAADIAAGTDSIEGLSQEVATAEADLKAATGIRKKEKADFTAVETDLVETVDILERAISILEREMKKHGASLLQATATAKNLERALSVIVDAGALGVQDKARLASLVQTNAGVKDSDKAGLDDEELADEESKYAELGAPDAATYKGHSSSIIDVLEDMLSKAETQLADARKEEMTAQHNFELLKQSLEDEMKNNEKSMADTKKAIATAQENKATAEGDLAVATKDLDEDTKYLKSIHQDCLEKATDFEAAVKSRDAELEALATAKKIIAEATAGGGEVVYGASSSFLQLMSETDWTSHHASEMGKMVLKNSVDLANFEVVRQIQKLAAETKSTALTQLAQRIRSVLRHGSESGEDPFAKVKDLIKTMIERLLDQAHQEASHKAYCDEEMAETKEKMGDLESTLDKLTTQIDKQSSSIAKLKEQVAELQAELATLAKSQAEMDKIRQEEHEVYVNAKKEMEEGLDGVEMALKVLRDYYAQEGDAHGKASGAGGGIIGMLEVIQADFSRSLAEANAAEDAAASEYDRISKENAITKVTKEQDVKYKTKEYKGLEKAVAEAKSDLSSAQAENAAVLEYMDKLKAQCIAKPMPYAERKKRREQEIAGLKEALAILEGESVFLQKKKGALHFLKRHQ